MLNMLQPVTGQTCSQGPRPTPTYSKPAILQKCKKALLTWIVNFLKLKYPPRLIESTINSLIRSQGQAEPQHQIPLDQPNTIVLLFKDQRSTDAVQKDLSELSKKIGRDLYPVFTSRKIIDGIKGVEARPPVINQHCIVYKFSCDLCDIDYVGYTSLACK